MTEARKVGYADVAGAYRQQIRDGELRPGDALPTVNAVAEEHGVARNTAARAFALLKSEGLIVTRAGAGTVVAEPPHVISGTDRLDRLNRTGRKYADGEEVTGRRVMRRSCVDPRICRELDIEPGEEVIVRIRTFRQDGKPTTVGLSVIHTRATADVPEVAGEEGMPRFWQELYRERTGREVTRGERTATARQASQDELDALEIDAPQHVAVAVLVTHVTFHDETGPIEHWEDVYAPGTEIPA
ncbi:GntR family transcriptional regulator [Streptomyces sp. SR27]|uniref:GntR family transcriptional regulator n=1 Tax=Streptomyces sp. SR27 TaxID=3076630 RepID=UPI00295B39F3|nr:GntR family transcriptional regulator [Streptomyces sp. SR27]MDV9190946.1 GntR family transcriptional regulator [Streptomyces sp. SR27]